MDDDAGFRQFVTARWPALVQSAYLITVDRGIAEDCVQEALTRVHRAGTDWVTVIRSRTCARPW